MSSSEKDKMVSGELYRAFELELVAERENANKLFTELNSLGKSSSEKREEIIKALFGKCGKNIWVESPFF